MKYQKGYKYQLIEDYEIIVCICPETDISTDYINLTCLGDLTIKKGYAWDGPSGPTIDTRNFMQGSLVHDALYQLIRNGLLKPYWRHQADKELRRLCLHDGMSKLRAWWVHKAVHLFGSFAADPKNKKKVHNLEKGE